MSMTVSELAGVENVPAIRPEVAALALAMEATLRRHDGKKPGWRTADLSDLKRGLDGERVEFDMALDAGPEEAVIAEAPDEANYLMMILDKLGLLTLPPGVTHLRIEEVVRR